MVGRQILISSNLITYELKTTSLITWSMKIFSAEYNWDDYGGRCKGEREGEEKGCAEVRLSYVEV